MSCKWLIIYGGQKSVGLYGCDNPVRSVSLQFVLIWGAVGLRAEVVSC